MGRQGYPLPVIASGADGRRAGAERWVLPLATGTPLSRTRHCVSCELAYPRVRPEERRPEQLPAAHAAESTTG